jgi:5-formaminoimidazole-4-carboxamide-1-(beta)-D-ribofuranosyl 5'-monophosphate synthetase
LSNQKDVGNILSEYDPKNLTVGVLGSHSAEEVGIAAKSMGLPSVVVCQKGRDETNPSSSSVYIE